jgi:hypothetical protein
MGYATGLGHRRSAASAALSARRPATVFLGAAIIEAPPAMPQASVLGDNAPVPAGRPSIMGAWSPSGDLQPPKPEITPSAKILQLAHEHDTEPEAAD